MVLPLWDIENLKIILCLKYKDSTTIVGHMALKNEKSKTKTKTSNNSATDESILIKYY